jgi:hypothetical protein
MIRIEKIWVVCFSPAGHEENRETLAGISMIYLNTAVETVDFTLPPARNKNYVLPIRTLSSGFPKFMRQGYPNKT